ncbi:MAG TPA: ABC transporter ATP-binding protein [Ilumatobacteraceae bacterium]|nr:ABC transporter ATP-binding protein [Ilumatobacteraceae bacterium]
MAERLLSIEQAVVRYDTPSGAITPVDGVDLVINEGETLGLVGESGCGKSTLGRLIIQLARANSGAVHFAGRDLQAMSASQLRSLRKELQVIFQDPRGSLDPKMSIRQIVAEPLKVHGMAKGDERNRKADEILEMVGLSSSIGHRRPGQLSGGQQQRVGIGRALITEPRLVVCDEPVSALDVSVQAQVINLLQDLKERLGVAYLFISHNLAVVRHLSDRVAVMYLGKIVEQGPSHDVFARPLHPYSRGLLASVLRPDTDAPERLQQATSFIIGDVPSFHDVPSGCRFHPRCPYASDRCREEQPVLEFATGEHAREHSVACHHWEEIIPMPVAVRAK